MNNTAYFDNAATTFPKPEEVYRFMDSFYRECGVNVGRGQHKLASQAAAMVAETRQLLLDLNHCPNRMVVFTPSATEALNIILNGIILKDGLNIYISPFEHNAVTRVVNHLKQAFTLKVYELAFDKSSFTYDIEKIGYQFAECKPDVVITSHASNVCGVLAPITEICALSKSHGAKNVIDMCQTMGLIDTNLNNENIDYAVFAAHKTLYGSLGLGGFICKENARPEPLLYGGTGIDSANPLLPDTLPERYEVGSPNVPAIAGLNAALKWISTQGIQAIYEKEQSNYRHLVNLLQKYDNIRIVAPVHTDASIGVVSCVFDGYGSDNIGQILSDRNIAVRTGLHCAPSAHRFLGTFSAGTVRFSVGYFNTDEEFMLLEEALNYIHENS
ncbi:cysteine desulfurase family protein [Natranaerovirga hydrolytica]|uniref:Cysteine desulfurase family protein n=1 Tax=Natranaerovirga hydrolytica TaxID=680378 RepID=A0A4R1MB17_9FIRM|nr:aminotransferase class V-fold PLP-dependent enzyme [Natranaerovirga hydrolytica]TCK89117.1 cysteine desulfurase family protein [Natranaerovirga hydrolytica]